MYINLGMVQQVNEEGVPPTTVREVSILRMLSRDPHVVRLFDVKHGLNKEGKNVSYLVFAYMETDLKKFIRSFRQTTEKVPLDIVKYQSQKLTTTLMLQLCKGIAFCHGHGILHRVNSWRLMCCISLVDGFGG
ncbi:cyclin-dependent kinase B2-2-like [Humulus lupulus]|uniref:cyclin-dependent kinase B2-2-like n=1 Tax=Humulus lupulus TaxID=3486 RepID=UPI002B40E650|nr:cyclin-dependent kinase B2-2-like [Humulus lupulus]